MINIFVNFHQNLSSRFWDIDGTTTTTSPTTTTTTTGSACCSDYAAFKLISDKWFL